MCSNNKYPENFSVTKRIRSFHYAFKGIKLFLKSQHNAWIHTVSAISVIILGFIFKVNLVEWILLIFAISFVFVAEIFNTAIEYLANIISSDYSEKVKEIKDISAGAVLISAITSVIIGVIVFLPKILHLF